MILFLFSFQKAPRKSLKREGKAQRKEDEKGQNIKKLMSMRVSIQSKSFKININFKP